MMSRFSDFVVLYKSLYLELWGLYLRFGTSFEVEIQYVNSSDHINTIFKHA